MVATCGDEVRGGRSVRLRPRGRSLPTENGIGDLNRHANLSLLDVSHDLRQRPQQPANEHARPHETSSPSPVQKAVSLRGQEAAPGHHNGREEMRHAGSTRDALLAPHGAESVRRGALLRQRRQLQQRPGMVQDADAALLPRSNHHREEPQLFRHT
jgi:hypothetical protein